MYKRSSQSWLKHLDFILLDVLSLLLAYLAAFYLRHGNGLNYHLAYYRTLGVVLPIADLLISLLFNTMHNVMKRSVSQELLQTLMQVGLVLAVIQLYLFSVQLGSIISRITVYLTAVFHYVLGFSVRQMWKPVVRKISRGRHKATMILVANEANVPEILQKADELDNFEYTGVILSNRDGTGETIGKVPVVSGLENAADYICREWVDNVFVDIDHLSRLGSLPAGNDSDRTGEQKGIPALIAQCREMAVPVHIRLPLTDLGGKTFMDKVGGYDVLTSTVNYASPVQLAIKRLMDIVGGLVGSLAALVVIAVVGPQIKKESPGPILFKQIRIGRNGKRFTCYKIRSMYMDAEERKQELLDQNRVPDGMMFKLSWDPRIIGNRVVNGKRVTGIGERIRQTSLDEFPQFFNVLLGQMSLVGTRPPTEDEWEKYKYHHRARLAIKPGLTGLWQVSGRSKITDFEEVVRLDTEYINNWSLSLDVKILLKTVRTVLRRDGAM